MKKIFSKELLIALSLLAIAILAFFQFVFYIHPPAYDMIDAAYPWRYFIGECLQHGKFPFWNPYQNLGYPIHADPNSGVWYPMVWLIGSFTGYTLYTLGLEFVFHVFLAGYGFYKLSKTMKLKDETSFIAAVSYMMCGVVVGNAQHIGLIIGASWLPFVLNYFIRLQKETSVQNVLKASVCMFMLITGSYPAIGIILFYLLLILFLFGCYTLRENRKALLNYALQVISFSILALLMSFGMIVSVLDAFPFITRSVELTMLKSLVDPFSPQACISFVLPFASIKNPEFFDSDISMSNAYFGLILFLFFIPGIFLKKTETLRIFFWFAVACLLASFGKYLPVREWLYRFLPGMNLFRFPAIFRLFVISGFILTGAFAFEKFILTEFERHKKTRFVVLVTAILFFLTVIITTRLSGYLNMKNFMMHDLFVFSKSSQESQHLAFQSFIQVVVLVAFIAILKTVWDDQKRKVYICTLIAVDLLLACQLNAPYTAYSGNVSTQKASAHVAKFPKGFPPLPENRISDVDPREMYEEPFWRNVSIFQKQVSADGYNPFKFTDFENLRDNRPALFSASIQHKIAFASARAENSVDLGKFISDSIVIREALFFNEKDLSEIRKTKLQLSPDDRVEFISFAPDSCQIHVSCKEPQLITLLQNKYPGWIAEVNGKNVPMYQSNGCFMTVLVPEGENKVLFVYRNPKIKYLFMLSAGILLACLLIIGWKELYKLRAHFE